eukprot:1581090-Amphidinium_carterae.1
MTIHRATQDLGNAFGEARQKWVCSAWLSDNPLGRSDEQEIRWMPKLGNPESHVLNNDGRTTPECWAFSRKV